MEFRELMKKFCMNCFLITGGCTVCATVFCAIFAPDSVFSVRDLVSVIMMGFLCALTMFIYWSKKEVSKKNLIIREVVQCMMVFAVVFGICYYNDWITAGSAAEPIVLFLLIAVYYLIVFFFNYTTEQRVADKMNRCLEELNQKEL